jgi:hypothetical protein
LFLLNEVYHSNREKSLQAMCMKKQKKKDLLNSPS